MLKYQIPPNNYPLWYGCVSGNLSELNSAIDLTVKQQGSCSLTTCESLYHHNTSRAWMSSR